MKISSAFPSNYLKASDLNGGTATVTMSKVVMEQIGRDKEERPVLYFRGHDKGMVLNKTNTKKISDVFGDETDNWSGGEIILFPAMVEFQGDVVEALRVKHARKQIPEAQVRPARPLKDYVEATEEFLPVPPGEPSAVLLATAEAESRKGIDSFRAWRDHLSIEDYEMLKPHMAKITAIAKQLSHDGKTVPKLSEEAKRTLTK